MKKVLAWAVVLALVLSSFTMAFAGQAKTSKDFSDASQIQYTEAVDVMVATGIINGYPDGTFGPQKTVKRSEMAKMIACIKNGGEDVGDQYKSACPFADSKDHWAAGYIAYCSAEHIIDGRSADVFDPEAQVTGTEVAKMALTSLGYDSKIQGYTGENWAAAVLKDAKKVGLFEGLDSSFVPGDPCSREAAAQILFNMLKATEVEYTNGTSVSIGDDISVVVDSAIKDQTWPKGDKKDDNKDGLKQMYEDVFGGKLAQKSSTTDEFGREAHAWTFEKDDIGTYADTADYEFVAKAEGLDAAVKAYDEDLAKDIEGYAQTIKVNGGEGTIGLGDKVELTVKAKTDEENGSVTAIVTQYKPYQITEVNTEVKPKDAEKGVTAYVSIDGLGKYNDTDIAGFDASTYEEEAVIAVAANAKKEILASYVMEELASGEITKVNSKTEAVTIDGTAYEKATNFEALDGVAFVDNGKVVEGEFTLYDYNGYYLASLQKTTPDTSADVLYGAVEAYGESYKTEQWTSDESDFPYVIKVKVFTPEGTSETYTVNEKALLDRKVEEASVGSLVAYTLNKDGEMDSLKVATESWNKEKMGANGVIKGKAVSEDVAVFFDAREKDAKVPAFKLYGFSDLEGANSISAKYFMEDGEVVAVLLTEPIEKTETILGFVTSVEEDTVSGGNQASVAAFVDGKAASYTSVVGEYTIDFNKDITELREFTLNGEGALKSAVKVNPVPVDGIQTTFPKDAVAVKMDVRVDGKKNNSLDIDSTADYDYQSVADADFYFINADGEMEASSYSAIKAGDNAILFQTDESSTAWNIVVFWSVPELDVVGAPMVDAVTEEDFGVPTVSYKNGVISIKYKDVPKHAAGDPDNTVAYWVGFGVKQEANATYGFGFAPSIEPAEADSVYEVDGTAYDTFYLGARTSFEGKTGLFKVNGNVYKVDLSGVTCKAEEPAQPALPVEPIGD